MKRQTVICIVGRPNVGKSSIFNRIIGHRTAIVHKEAGTTRDRISAVATYKNKKFVLVDTAGITTVNLKKTHGEFEKEIQTQIRIALEQASAIIFVVDVQSGMHPLDEEVAMLLRKTSCPVFLAANKADNPQLAKQIIEFERFGFPIYPVSALHNFGFMPLLDALVSQLPDEDVSEQVNNILKIAIVGRPNVGKSSYINKILNENRVIVTDVPGTTRDSIDIPFTIKHGKNLQNYLLIDTAGLKKTTKIKNQVEWYARIRTEKNIAKSDIVMFIIDATTGPTEQDKRIGSMILEYEKGCVILANKIDITELKEQTIIEGIRHILPFLNFCPIICISCKTGRNIKKSLQLVNKVSVELQRQIPTSALNHTLHNAYIKVQPPRVKGKVLKIFYATQTKKAPLQIRLFVNNPQLATKNYIEYLKHSVRNEFGLDGVPILFELKSRTHPQH